MSVYAFYHMKEKCIALLQLKYPRGIEPLSGYNKFKELRTDTTEKAQDHWAKCECIESDPKLRSNPEELRAVIEQLRAASHEVDKDVETVYNLSRLGESVYKAGNWNVDSMRAAAEAAKAVLENLPSGF